MWCGCPQKLEGDTGSLRAGVTEAVRQQAWVLTPWEEPQALLELMGYSLVSRDTFFEKMKILGMRVWLGWYNDLKNNQKDLRSIPVHKAKRSGSGLNETS